MTLKKTFLDIAKTHASNPVLIFEAQSFTYAQLTDEAQKVADRQQKEGYNAGSVYVTEKPNGFSLLSEFFACVLNDLVFCPIFERKTLREKEKIRSDIEGKFLPKHSGVIFQTSGSTGTSKYIFQSFDHLLKNARYSSSAQGLSSDTWAYSTLPFSHTGGMNMQVLPTILSGGRIEWDKSFTAPRAMQALRNANTAVIVPTQLDSIFRHKQWEDFEFQKGTHILTGSMSVPQSVFQQLYDKGVDVFNVYGLTEVGPFVSLQKTWTPLPETALSSLGKPLSEYNVTLDAESLEIQIEGPCIGKKIIMSEGRELKVEEVYKVQTGDIGLFKQGELFFCGRIKRRINTSGMKYSPEEVEITLREHPGVYDAYVDRKVSQSFGEVGIAYIEGNVEVSDLREFLRARLSSYKIPREFKFVEELERSDIDKPRVSSGEKIESISKK